MIKLIGNYIENYCTLTISNCSYKTYKSFTNKMIINMYISKAHII